MLTRSAFLFAVAMTSALCLPLSGESSAPAGSATHYLWYAAPAAKWEEALPVGNGRLGAMIFGGSDKERLQLNDVTVWSGKPEHDTDRPDAYKSLPEIRRLLNEQKYKEAAQLTKDKMTNQGGGFDGVYNGSYQTLGDLTLEFQQPVGERTDYRRWLDIDRAVAGVDFKIGSIAITRDPPARLRHGSVTRELNLKKGESFKWNGR